MAFVNISKPYNTRYSIGERLSESTWFFGGSTIWGYGNSDNYTIPSIYSKKNNSYVFNFGEQAWVTRQSLNQLINILGDGYKPEVVVFYGGFNDISVGCRKENHEIPAHAYQNHISKIMKNKQGNLKSYTLINFITEPYIKIYNKYLVDLLKKIWDMIV